MRFIYLSILIIIVTSTLYFKNGLLSGFLNQWNKPAINKKVRAVKPKQFNNELDNLKPFSQQFTFFETLEDKTMTKYVGLHGEILPVSLPSKALLHSQEKKVLNRRVDLIIPKLESGKNIKRKINSSQSTQLRFVVQVSSFRNERMARELKIKLQEKGFGSFLIETELPNHGGKWFRVFLGKYSNEELAQKDAKRAIHELKLNTVVVKKKVG